MLAPLPPLPPPKTQGYVNQQLVQLIHFLFRN